MSHNIVIFEPSKHLIQIANWLSQWNLSLKVLDSVSSTGLIVEDVAALFAYETNSKMCFLELMICNRDADEKIRDKALDQLVKTMMHMMKEKGYKYITSNSPNPSVVQRAIDNGFEICEKQTTTFIRSL